MIYTAGEEKSLPGRSAPKEQAPSISTAARRESQNLPSILTLVRPAPS
jgi:hypothetical protein